MNYATTMPRPSIGCERRHPGFIDEADIEPSQRTDKSVKIACGSYNNVRNCDAAPGGLLLRTGKNTARKRLRLLLA
jgi:hypothetical protein